MLLCHDGDTEITETLPIYICKSDKHKIRFLMKEFAEGTMEIEKIDQILNSYQAPAIEDIEYKASSL